MSHPPRPKKTLQGTSFLDEVVDAILAHPLRDAQKLHRLAVVLPSHRAMSRIRKALHERLDAPRCGLHGRRGVSSKRLALRVMMVCVTPQL